MTPPGGSDGGRPADAEGEDTADADDRGEQAEADGRADRADGSESATAAEQRVDPSEAFAALSDPLRVEILRELATAHREREVEPVGFADLRKRVEVRDSGRFRYHLNELRDNFVRKGEGGYRLTVTGVETVAAILAGTYTHGGSMGPEPIDSECSACASAAVATYRDGRCAVTCENDHPLFGWTLPPAAAADATLPEVVSLAELYARQAIERALAGVCPKCSAPVDPRIVVEGDDADSGDTGAAEATGPLPGLRVRCETCGGRLVGPVGFCLLVDPAVAAFYRRHDRPLDALHVWEPAFVADDDTVEVVERDPLRVAVEVTLDGDRLAVTVDESGRVSVREG
ncbi:winged helix-turn-helix domain-containing protein [Halosimplex pelagicum]|uniref:ArsR family transcriptional regulator n=1 Tax=Halosimplex pelagicum TaxID=869886 RepID=A0A7D5TFS1_9EURY|nr:winged helix-turn-helix domain-containing protein [Halosimplex pelagicum]QLH80716.1 ArsR family transcriptional regulator [Halosimplex pelagicum]